MSLQTKLKQLGTAFAGVTQNCYHYWRPVKTVPCLIWAESGEDGSFHSNNRKSEQNIIGTVDLFTKTEFDPLADDVQATLEDLGVAWRLESVQFEDETDLIHMEWTWEVAFNGDYQSDGDG